MKKIIIYGGSSLLSQEIIKIYKDQNIFFIIFCRNKKKMKNILDKLNVLPKTYKLYEVDLINLKKNINLIKKIHHKINGIIWLAGYTGNVSEEFNNSKKCQKNIKVNFLHPVIIINKLIYKFNIKNKNNFVLVFTAVAGIRGRASKMFYCSAKSGLISYLSGLRQKLFFKNINVITVIPGYMDTYPFKKLKIKTTNFLVSNPKKVAKIIFRSILLKKDVVYINWTWRYIMFLVNLIPEFIFKRLNF